MSGVGYARIPGTFSELPGGGASNSSRVTFPIALSNWGLVTHFGVFDALSGGNLLYFNEVVSPLLVRSGVESTFETGSLVVFET